MHAKDSACWFPSYPQLAHPKIILLSPTQWACQTVGKFMIGIGRVSRVHD